MNTRPDNNETDSAPVAQEPSEAMQAANEATKATPEERSEIADLIMASRSLTERASTLIAARESGTGEERSLASSEINRVTNENAQLRRDIDDLGKRMSEKASVPDTDDLFADKETGRFSVARCVQAAFCGWDHPNLKDSPERKALDRWQEEKALPHDTIGGLGVIVPPQYMTDYIERLSARTVAFELGARFMGNLTGAPVEWPKVEGGATAQWIGENAEPTDSEVTVGALRLAPKELACSAPISKKLLRLAGQEAQDLIEEDLMRAHGETLDTGILNGGGGEATPLGIINVPGVGQTNFTGGSEPGDEGLATIDLAGSGQNITEYLDVMIAKVDARNAYNAGGGMGFACHPLTLNRIRRSKDEDGKPLLVDMAGGGTTVGSPQTATYTTGRGSLWGHPVATTTNLAYGASSDLIFGAWSEVIVGGWGPMEVEVSDNYSDYFKRRRLLILITQLVDAGLRHPEAFEIATNLNMTSLGT